jgi:NAD(P)-dependent dehydrogenase (short-subunit alcohol dehydrogenase family)
VTQARFDDKAVLVTGAASGIGRETALAFAERGAQVFLSDVDEKGLGETAEIAKRSGGTVHAVVADVSRRDAMKALAEAVHREVPALDVLVNNAGVGLGARFLDTPLEDWDWIVGINLMGVVHGCHFFVPRMVERGRGGHVVNVASAAGLLATSELAAYATTKYGVVGLSEALREELRPHGIRVVTICPGIVNTPITRSSRLRGVAAGERERIEKLYQRRNYGPEKVARAIVRAVVKKRGLVPVTPEAWLMYALKRAMPETTPRLLHGLAERGRARAAKARKA